MEIDSNYLDKQVEITYIKNKKEITKKIPQRLFWEYQTSEFLRIPQDIELLRIKGLYCLRNSMMFECEKEDTKLILEDCYFKDTMFSNLSRVTLLYPHFVNRDASDVIFMNSKGIDFVFEDKNTDLKKIHCSIINSKNISICGDASNINLSISYGKDPISMKVENAKNLFIPRYSMPFEKLSIKNSQKIEIEAQWYLENLEILNSRVRIDSNYLGLCEKDSVIIKNSILESTGSYLKIPGDVVIEQSFLKCRGDSFLRISDGVYYISSKEGNCFTLGDHCNQSEPQGKAISDLLACLREEPKENLDRTKLTAEESEKNPFVKKMQKQM